MSERLRQNCSTYYRFSDLIECGATFNENLIDNMPKESDTFLAIQALAENILDPITSEFGSIQLTRGFSSFELTKKVPGLKAMNIDQHIGHERNRNGKLYCSRGGMAVDFICKEVDSVTLASFIVNNLPFDRLYFYNSHRPIHVSYGDEHTRQIVVMNYINRLDRFMPRVVPATFFTDHGQD